MSATTGRATTAPVASIGAALPDYEVSRELGRGAMGVVYLGRHRRLGRDVAIKELAGPLADDGEVRSRFLTEARTLATLDHPHVVPVYDYVEDGGRCLLIMEALPGGTVWELFSRQGLHLERACALALAVCSGLAHAHEHGILHRDVKPENLLFAASGELKVTDFGIAKVLDGGRTLATVDGSVLGTPAYMAPEQAEGADVSPAADVYAVATMLYEFASGRLPFDGDSPMALLVQRLTTDPPDLTASTPNVPAPVAAAIMAGLARSPADRTPTAEAFGCALAEAAVDAWGPDWLDAAGVTVGGSRAIAAAAGGGRTLPPLRRVDPGTDRDAEPGSYPEVATGTDTDIPDAPGGQTSRATTPPGQTRAPDGADRGSSPAAGAADDPTATLPPRGPTPATEVVRPAVEAHQPGFDPEAIDRRDLVDIGEVLGREVPIARAALAAVATALAAVALVVLAPMPAPENTLDAGVPLLAEGQPTGSGTVTLDLTQPISVSTPDGVDATAVVVELTLAGMPVGSHEAPVAGRTATVDAGTTGWLLHGPVEATITATGADGEALAQATYAIRNEREPWQSAHVPALVVAAAFGFAAAEAQTRRHRRGRVRTGALVGAAVGAALFGAATVALWSVWRDQLVGPGSVLAVAGAAAGCGAATTIVRARRARRRRLRLRAER